MFVLTLSGLTASTQVLLGACSCVGTSQAAVSCRASLPAPPCASLSAAGCYCCLLHCGPQWLQEHSCPTIVCTMACKETLAFNTWSTSSCSLSPDLGVCRAAFFMFSSLTYNCGTVFFILKYHRDGTNVIDWFSFGPWWVQLVAGWHWLWDVGSFWCLFIEVLLQTASVEKKSCHTVSILGKKMIISYSVSPSCWRSPLCLPEHFYLLTYFQDKRFLAI